MSYRSDVYKSDGNVRSKSTVQKESNAIGAHTQCRKQLYYYSGFWKLQIALIYVSYGTAV